MPADNHRDHASNNPENFLVFKLLSELFPDSDHRTQTCNEPWRQLRKKLITQTDEEEKKINKLLTIEEEEEEEEKERCYKYSSDIDWDALINLMEKQFKRIDVFVKTIKEIEQHYQKQTKKTDCYTKMFSVCLDVIIKNHKLAHNYLSSAIEMANSAKQDPSKANVKKIYKVLEESFVNYTMMLDGIEHKKLDSYLINLFTKNPDHIEAKSENPSNADSTFVTPSSKQNIEHTPVFIESQHRCIPKEEELASKIKAYSKLLSKKNCSSAQAKSESLLKIVQTYEGIDKNSLSVDQVSEIRNIINAEKETLRQHRHWSVFNCFFHLFKPATLENRVTSNRLITDLDNYLELLEEKAKSNLKL